MGKVQVIETTNKGSWVSSPKLTEYNIDSSKYRVVQNAIDRYRYSTEKKVGIETINFSKDKNDIPLLNIPKFELHYDIENAKKFSKKIQSWKGVILNVNQETFSARLYDQTDGGTDEIAEFELNDVSPDDMELLDEGSVFYWSVGHFMENGQSIKKSEIRFQRLVKLSISDIDSISDIVELKYSNLKERKIDD